jgi:hypothetical protein
MRGQDDPDIFHDLVDGQGITVHGERGVAWKDNLVNIHCCS